MISVKRINFKRLFITFFFIIEIVPDFRRSSIVWWGCVFALGFVSFLDSIERGKIACLILRPYEKWLLLFFGYCLLSITWAISKAETWVYVPTIIVTGIICILLSQMISNEDDLNFLFHARFVATVVLTVYIYINIDISVLGNERIGSTILGEGWNSNSIALFLTTGILLGLQEIKNSKVRIYKLLVALFMVGMFTIMMLCGSRTAFIIAVFGISSYIWLSAKNTRIIVTFVSVGVVFLFLYLVMVIPGLYNVLGYRLELLQEGLQGNAARGSGTELRLMMISYLPEFFSEHPFLGAGMNNFRVLFGRVFGIFYYAHNNHVEVIVDLGITGAILYYGGYFFLLKNGMKGFRKGLNKYQVFCVSTACTLLLAGIGTVSYMLTTEQLLIMMAFSSLRFSMNKEQQ